MASEMSCVVASLRGSVRATAHVSVREPRGKQLGACVRIAKAGWMPVDPLSPKDPRSRQLRGADHSDSAQPNWVRGFSRLWILATIAWILGWGVYLSIYTLRFGEATNDLLKIPVILIGPPMALLAFGRATLWAFRGFVPEEKSRD